MFYSRTPQGVREKRRYRNNRNRKDTGHKEMRRTPRQGQVKQTQAVEQAYETIFEGMEKGMEKMPVGCITV